MISMRILLSLAVGFGAFASAGVLVGNGTDNYGPQEGAAWFVDENRTIEACYELSTGFGSVSICSLFNPDLFCLTALLLCLLPLPFSRSCLAVCPLSKIFKKDVASVFRLLTFRLL